MYSPLSLIRLDFKFHFHSILPLFLSLLFSDLVHCTNEPNVSIPHLANLLIERSQNTHWVVVYKALITTHHLMAYGNEVSLPLCCCQRGQGGIRWHIGLLRIKKYFRPLSFGRLFPKFLNTPKSMP